MNLIKCWTPLPPLVQFYRKYVGALHAECKSEKNINTKIVQELAQHRNPPKEKKLREKRVQNNFNSTQTSNSKSFSFKQKQNLLAAEMLVAKCWAGIFVFVSHFDNCHRRSWIICARVSTSNNTQYWWHLALFRKIYSCFQCRTHIHMHLYVDGVWLCVWRQKPTDFQIFVHPLVRLLPNRCTVLFWDYSGSNIDLNSVRLFAIIIIIIVECIVRYPTSSAKLLSKTKTPKKIKWKKFQFFKPTEWQNLFKKCN